MARRTYADYQASVVHALGGEPATGLSKTQIVNDALRHLCTLRSWTWRRGGPVLLSLTGPLAVVGATWTNATRTLTLTGGFTAYVFSVGDRIQITGGTGATQAWYTVESRTSNDAIVLTTTIGAAADGQTDIAGTIYFPYVNLPSDFGEEYAVEYPQTFTRQMVRTTLAEIERMRSSPIQAVAFTFYYAVNFGTANAAVDPLVGMSVPRLELYPTPNATVPGAISLTYLRDLREMGNSLDVPIIPDWMDYAFDLLCRSFAMTMEDDNPANSAQQMFDRLLPDLIKRDGQVQNRLGVMRGGLYPSEGGINPLYPVSIGDPSF